MNTIEHSHPLRLSNFRLVIGTLLVLSGGLLFLDRYLQTGWLSLAVLPGSAAFLFLWGIRLRHHHLMLAGGLIGGLGAGAVAAFRPGAGPQSLVDQFGFQALYLGIGWCVVVAARAALTTKPGWWGMVPGGILVSLGYCLLFTPLRWVDFVFYLACGIGAPLLIWGLIARLIGLVIPGCLLVTTGPGIFMAWQSPESASPLVHTGVMLVWFALGWLLITISGRVTVRRFFWWPLIPGSILAMVGWGLYIGGDPDNALGFIGNTGSIGLMIFGLYLLLMRKGIHH
jgi:hypothetical protein